MDVWSERGGGEKRLRDNRVASLDKHRGAITAAAHELAADVGGWHEAAVVAESIPRSHLIRTVCIRKRERGLDARQVVVRQTCQPAGGSRGTGGGVRLQAGEYDYRRGSTTHHES